MGPLSPTGGSDAVIISALVGEEFDWDCELAFACLEDLWL